MRKRRSTMLEQPMASDTYDLSQATLKVFKMTIRMMMWLIICRKLLLPLICEAPAIKPYVPNVILEKIIIDLEDEVVNPLEKEKVNLETIESLKSKSFESSEKVCSESENQSENDCLVIEKECDKEENPKVIAPGILKLNVSQCVSPISMSKSSCDSNNVEIKVKRKRLF
nr:hypothetical protein [Tanacetum cinerariifolium]